MENSDAVCVITYFSFYFCGTEFLPILPSKVVHSLSNGNSGPWISKWTSELVSVWLHIDLQVDLTKETLMKQFQIVKEETDTSHVMQYGDMVYVFYITGKR